MNSLRPSMAQRPTNSWLGILNLILGFSLLLFAWSGILKVFRSPMPISDAEYAAYDASAAVLPWVLERLVAADPFGLGGVTTLRIVSCVALVLSTVVAARLVWKLSGPLLCAASMTLWMTFPALQAVLLTEAGESIALLCFLVAFSKLNLSERRSWSDLLIVGVFGGLALLFSAVWALALLGLVLGTAEVRVRHVVPVVAGAFTSVALLTVLAKLFDGRTAPTLHTGIVTGGEPVSFGYVFLFCCVSALFLWGGALRRGAWWWTLAGSSVSFALSLLTELPLGNPLPFVLLAALSVARLCQLLDLRFPVVYQSVLAVQMLLWLPTALEPRGGMLLPVQPEIGELRSRFFIVNAVNETGGTVHVAIDGVEPLLTGEFVDVLGDHTLSAHFYVVRKADVGQIEGFEDAYRLFKESDDWALYVLR